MRRILLMVIRNILFVPVYWYKLCYHARHVEKYTEEEHYELLRYIDHRANTSGNINIKVYGQENIPDDNGFMFYPNHQGLYDVLAIMEACPRPFSVVAKKEVANVPFLKQVFECMKAYRKLQDLKRVIRYRNSKAEVSKRQPGQNVRSCQLRWLIVLCHLIPRQQNKWMYRCIS